jgi:hypothetical protein
MEMEMEHHGIKPERITKPIQLLASWLIGLFVTNASFLLAAKQIHHPSWGAALLLVAAVANVPVFILALFLLQTKFRPQMQEDQYYSKYLDDERKSTAVSVPERDLEQEIARTVERIVASVGASAKGMEEPISEILHQTQVELLASKHGGTRAFSQIYYSPSTWGRLVEKFRGNGAFQKELDGMLDDGLVVVTDDDPSTAVLTNLGKAVGNFAREAGMLFAQKNRARWMSNQRQFSNESNAEHRD